MSIGFNKNIRNWNMIILMVIFFQHRQLKLQDCIDHGDFLYPSFEQRHPVCLIKKILRWCD